MKRSALRGIALLGAAVLLLTLSGCFIEQPEPLWTEEEYTGERAATELLTAGGIRYQAYSDRTAEAVGIDEDSFTGSALRLADAVNGIPVTKIADGAFEGLAITDLTLPAGLVAIGDRAFRQTAIRALELPDSLTQLGEDAFDGCRSLKTVTFGKGLASLPLGAFYGCVALREIELPEGVVSVGAECFSDCRALEKAGLPESLKEIGAYAFWNAGTEDLVFTVPAGVRAIGSGAFKSTAWLDAQTEAFVTVGDGVLIRYNGTEKEVLIPDGIKYVSDAFAGTAVTKVTLPAGVEESEDAWEEVPGIEVVRG